MGQDSNSDTINRLCDAFAAAFRAGHRPSIEDFIAEHPTLRQPLLGRLIALELQLRRQQGDLPTKSEYTQRFPNDQPCIEAAFTPETQEFSEPEQTWPIHETADLDGQLRPHPSSDSLDTSPSPPNAPADGSQSSDESHVMPTKLGRYEVRRILGKGGFGVVYLAHDPQLDRLVAVKVPRPDRFKTAQQVANFMQEARTAANLRHPGLVTVYDVQEENGIPFIVQEFINGETLASWITKVDRSFEEIAAVLMGICEAVSYAHQQRLTHCDLKMANVLMDRSNRPFVADFGLAVHDSVRASRHGARFGTPPVMAPEQVRGEGHRLDGRTDIWAIGVIMYELLVKQRPFMADSESRLFHEIEMVDPRPPRQIDRHVPRELERICLKCLQKRRVSRYPTVDDLRDDLLAWLSQNETANGSPQTQINSGVATLNDSESTSKTVLNIIPKGLRSFEVEDADFFLGLLPGPRDREGLPDCVRFWKNRIEERSADDTFAVGLMYGPSGCGKTSLVKAGLLPRLDAGVLAIYIEATADNTETRIRRQLVKHFPWLSPELSLPDLFAELRGIGGGKGRKLVLIIDQFEQWLHANPELKQAPLVDALRQCEGGMLQAVLMVRDDFFASVHRLFQELETPLLEDTNYSLIDRFDKQHARQVLTAFGRAYDRFEGRLTSTEQQFVKRVVDELAELGKVVCVRLALFADMMKARPWTLASLREIGGVSGVGVTFLEETFNATTSPPSHRVHEPAIRLVLGSLLPEAGLDIKGCMRSEDELRQAVGADLGRDRLAEIIRILDHELRIITPTEPNEQMPLTERAASDSPTRLKYYQLTHDYLVSSLREWLNRRKSETRKGRAELTLAARASAWNAKRENRQLPTFVESLRILTLTDRKRWTETEAAMMRQSQRMLFVRTSALTAIAACVVLVGMLVSWRIERFLEQRELDGLVQQLEMADLESLSPVLDKLDLVKQRSEPVLTELVEHPDTGDDERLRGLLFLAPHSATSLRSLLDQLATADVKTVAAVRKRFAMTPEVIEKSVLDRMRAPHSSQAALRYIAALSRATQSSQETVQANAIELSEALLDEQVGQFDRFCELLASHAPGLVPQLVERFHDTLIYQAQRDAAARALAQFADAKLLCELVAEASPSQHHILCSSIGAGSVAAQMLVERLQSQVANSAHTQRTANMLIALLRIAPTHELVERCLSEAKDPTARTHFIAGCFEYGVPLEKLVQAMKAAQSPLSRQALLLALEPYRVNRRYPNMHQRISGELKSLASSCPEYAVRSAAQWVLARWNVEVPPVDSQFLEQPSPIQGEVSKRNWWQNKHDQVMVILDMPVSSDNPQTLSRMQTEAKPAPSTASVTFAIGATEVTRAQLSRFDPNFEFQLKNMQTSDCPANNVSFVVAMQYCRWLSEEEGIHEDQMCYPRKDEIGLEHANLDAAQLKKTGYRLPTEAEWEWACGGASRTPWNHGEDSEKLELFAWMASNSEQRLHPVASLMPNCFGLSDCTGNVAEWCHPAPGADEGFALRGGNYTLAPQRTHTLNLNYTTSRGYSFTGFRVAKTVAKDSRNGK